MPSVRSDVVINTGPVLALAAAGYLHVLRDLFTKVTIPYEVVQEIEAGGRTGAEIKLRTSIERMRQQGIWLSEALEKECLRLAGE